MTTLLELLEVTNLVRQKFTQLVAAHGAGGLTLDRYQRYLSMQYYLTKDVQRYFFTAAAHHDLAKMRKLRRFLTSFANEEELHYLVAASDLNALNLPLAPLPFDVELWHTYFTSTVTSRPFMRLGAASVLENLSDDDNREQFKTLLRAPFLNRGNTKFLVLHMHETLPHGEQILQALQTEHLTEPQLCDLVDGAKKGGLMYLRMAEWALDGNALSHLADSYSAANLSDEEVRRIERFEMAELAA